MCLASADFSTGDRIQHAPLDIFKSAISIVNLGTVVFERCGTLCLTVRKLPQFLLRHSHFEHTRSDFITFHNGSDLHNVIAGRYRFERNARIIRSDNANQLIVAFPIQFMAPCDSFYISTLNRDRTVFPTAGSNDGSTFFLHGVFNFDGVGVKLVRRTLREPL